MQPVVSVVIRLTRKDSLSEALIANLYAQDIKGIELVLLPTYPAHFPELTDRYPLRVLEVPGTSPGAALNAGFAATTGRYVIVLSPRAMPRDYHWIATLLRHFADRKVAAVSGWDYDLDKLPFKDSYYRQDLLDFLSDPRFGLSNVNAAYLREAWEQHPFDEDLEACEDKEWGYRVLQAGYEVVLDYEARTHYTQDEDAEEAFKRYWRAHRSIARFLVDADTVCRQIWQHAIRKAIADRDVGSLVRARQRMKQVREMSFWQIGGTNALAVRKEFAEQGAKYRQLS